MLYIENGPLYKLMRPRRPCRCWLPVSMSWACSSLCRGAALRRLNFSKGEDANVKCSKWTLSPCLVHCCASGHMQVPWVDSTWPWKPCSCTGAHSLWEVWLESLADDRSAPPGCAYFLGRKPPEIAEERLGHHLARSPSQHVTDARHVIWYMMHGSMPLALFLQGSSAVNASVQ